MREASRTAARGRRAAALRALVAGAFLVAHGAAAQGDIALPSPQIEGGKPLMQALSARRTTRAFGDQALPRQTLANLLWAAFGINRPETGGRTAPSARNWQEIEIYVALPEGLYRYDAKANTLRRVLGEDIRAQAGTQSHAREAPATLIYVADEKRTGLASAETRDFYAAADTGFIAQNVYLFCASEGLGTVVYASIDRERLAKTMGLALGQRITLAQSVGYPRR